MPADPVHRQVQDGALVDLRVTSTCSIQKEAIAEWTYACPIAEWTSACPRIRQPTKHVRLDYSLCNLSLPLSLSLFSLCFLSLSLSSRSLILSYQDKFDRTTRYRATARRGGGGGGGPGSRSGKMTFPSRGSNIVSDVV